MQESTERVSAQRGVVTTRLGDVHFEEQGRGPCLFAIHGLPGSSRDFARFGASLAGQGVRVVAFDIPGYAEQPRLGLESTWTTLAEALGEACAALSERPYGIMAHSFGAHLALRIARADRRARMLALLAPAGLRPHRAVRSLGPRAIWRTARHTAIGQQLFFAGLQRSGVGKNVSRGGSDLTLDLLATADFAAAAELYRALDIPVFAARCEDDQLVEPRVVDELVAALRHGELRRFASGGHAPHKFHGEELAPIVAARLRDACTVGGHSSV